MQSILAQDAKIASRTSSLPARLGGIFIIVFFAFLLLSSRLWQLQIVHGEENYLQTMQNVLSSRVIMSVRGKILDRNMTPIADNRPAFNIYGIADEIDESLEANISSVLRLNKEERRLFASRLKTNRGQGKIPRVLLEDQGRDRAALVMQEQSLGLLEVRDEPFRYYPKGKSMSHLIGYMNRITPAELFDREKDGYRANDLVGRNGLEKSWERYLRGKRGLERFVVNAAGKRIEESAETKGLISEPKLLRPVPGHNVVLTIDLELQEVVEKELMRQAAGAVAVVEVNTGKILALASTPSFDPNVMSGNLSRLQYGQMLSDPRKPFVDKTLRQPFAPGSTYKFVVALAALQEQLVSINEPLTCNGSHSIGNHEFRCHGRHGSLDLKTALQKSCNVYFWKLAERVGIDAMAKAAKEFGFGEPTGLGLNGDTSGRVPTREWYEERDVYRVGYALNAATGQGDVEVGVLQLAVAYAALASGVVYVPQVVDRVEDASGEVVVRYGPQERNRLNFSSNSLDAIREGMWKVVNQPGGTGYKHARSSVVEYSGKSGTAQVRAMKNRDDDNALTNWHPDRDHAWFAGFAPSENPEIALVVFLEHGGFGGSHAGPIAKAIVDAFFAKRVISSGASETKPMKVLDLSH